MYADGIASQDNLRYTRDANGLFTSRQYRCRTMLTEEGGIYAVGELHVLDPDDGKRYRKLADITLAIKDLREKPKDTLVDALSKLDEKVEAAEPVLIEE